MKVVLQGAVRADETDELAVGDLQVNSGHRPDAAEADRIVPWARNTEVITAGAFRSIDQPISFFT